VSVRIENLEACLHDAPLQIIRNTTEKYRANRSQRATAGDNERRAGKQLDDSKSPLREAGFLDDPALSSKKMLSANPKGNGLKVSSQE
jgi:hypothetical protein